MTDRPRDFKCHKCAHYYRTMVNKSGYNPNPFCHKLEDTGERPNIWTQECFAKRSTPRRKAKTSTQER